MKIFTLALILILVLTGYLAFLNWAAFSLPTDIWIGFASIQMPIGVLLLGILACITVLFLLYVIYLQTTSLLETRRLTRKLEANIALAEKAEQSRFTELKNALASEMLKHANLNLEAKSAILASIGQIKTELRSSIEQSGNTLSAHIGEFEDKFEKSTPRV